MKLFLPKVPSLALILLASCESVAIAGDWSHRGLSGISNLATLSTTDFGLFANNERIKIHQRPADLAKVSPRSVKYNRSGGKLDRLKSLIALAEAGPKGYDAVISSAKSPPPGRPTALTVGQILVWVKRTPGQNHAIGRYQFIPSTLRNLVRRGGIPVSAQFTPQLQDRLADMLLQDAGVTTFQSGKMSRMRFMNNLALIWAGLPTSSGRSAYHGHAGNRATIDWVTYDREMAAIFR